MTEVKKPELPSELWDAKDVARFLKVSRSWVYQRAQAGLLPCLHIGGLLRFEPETIRAFARGEGQTPHLSSVHSPFRVGHDQ